MKSSSPRAARKPLRLLQENPGRVDLLLTDVVMPDMNGRALYEAARHIRPGLRVLYMSGYARDVLADRGVSERAAAFLQKPFPMPALAEKLRQALSEPPPQG